MASVLPAKGVNIVEAVRRLVDCLDEKVPKNDATAREEVRKRRRRQEMFVQAYEILLDWGRVEVAAVSEEDREEHVELGIARCVYGKQQEGRYSEASRISEQCEVLRRYNIVDLHVDAHAKAPIHKHHIIPLASQDAVLSLLLALEGSVPRWQRPKRGNGPRMTASAPLDDQIGNGWISTHLFAVDDEIDPLNWTSFHDGAPRDSVEEQVKNGLWWGQFMGSTGQNQPSLWDFTGKISSDSNQSLIQDLDNSWSSWAGNFHASKHEPGGHCLQISKVRQPHDEVLALEPVPEPAVQADAQVEHMSTDCGQENRLLEKELAVIVLQALEGVLPAIDLLENKLPRSGIPQAASISKLTERLCRAGRCRSWLEAFIDNCLQPRKHATKNDLPTGKYVDHVHFGFASAINTVLRWHTAALLHVMEAVKDRREQESMEKVGPDVGWTKCQDMVMDQTCKLATSRSKGGNLHQVSAAAPGVSTSGRYGVQTSYPGVESDTPAELHGTGPGGIDATLLELVVHTKRIQHQTMVLASICRCPLSSNWERDMQKSEMDIDGETDSGGYTFELPEAPELLGLLHRALLEADNILGPMIRYLFTCSFQPYLQHVRQWLFTPTTPSHAFLHPAALKQEGHCQIHDLVPCAPPDFLSEVHDMFVEAGRQVRILQEMDFVKGAKELVSYISDLGSQETAEVQRIIKSIGDEWGTCDLGFGEVTLRHLCQHEQSRAYFPVPFRVDALHKALEVMSHFSQLRMKAVDSWLRSLADARDLAKKAEEAKIKKFTAARLAVLEAKKRQEEEELEEGRRQRRRLFQEYKAAAERSIADKAVAKAKEIEIEQSMLESSARQQYNEAAALVSAELREAEKVGADLEEWGIHGALTKSHGHGEDKANSPARECASGGLALPELIRLEDPEASPRIMEVEGKEDQTGVVSRQGNSGAELIDDKLSGRQHRWGGGGRSKWGPVIDPRPAAGMRPSLHIDVNVAQDGGPASGTCDSVRFPAQRMVTETYRASRSKWKFDMEKGLILEEVDVDEKWLLGGEESLVPVSAIVDAMVIQPIRTQFRCTSYACSELFLHELGFMDLCKTLGRFFFMGAGDWALILTESMCSHAYQHGCISNSNLHRILSKALQDSCLNANEVGDKVTLQVDPDHPVQFQKAMMATSPVSQHESKPSDSQPQEAEGPSCNSVDIRLGRLQALDSIALKYHIPWPMCLLLTPEVMHRYANVFTGLLKYRLVEWWLNRVWWKLRETTRAGNGPMKCATKGYTRLQMVHVWYMDAKTLVSNLRGFMEHQLLQQHWVDLEREVTSPGLSLGKLQEAHDKYLSAAATSCFLNSSIVYKRLRTVVDQALQNILAFCGAVDQNVMDTSDGEIPILLQLFSDDAAWEEITRRAQDSIKRGQALFRMLKYRANRGEVAELFILMTFNSYYQDRSAD